MVHLAECFEQHLCRSGIQRTGRLICEDQFTDDESSLWHRHNAASGPPGYLIGEFIPDFFDIKQLQYVITFLLDLSFPLAVQRHCQHNILFYRKCI